MKKYIGTKQVSAEPMTYGEAHKNGLVRNYVSGNDDAEGYKVVYADSYTSWSPKEVFDKAYKLAETPLDRIYIELHELNVKLLKAIGFTRTEAFESLDIVSRSLLQAQIKAMEQYQSILYLRKRKMEGSNARASELSFGDAVNLLEEGFALRRSGWNGKHLMVFKQVPAHIADDIIPKMQSLTDEAKRLILANTRYINYSSQCLIYNSVTGRADSWVPSISDVFANDWEVVAD